MITVGSALAVSDERRDIFEAFDRESCSFWPVNLFSKTGVDFGARYWIVHTSKVIAAEYISKEWKMWWGDKIAGFNDVTIHNYGMGGWHSDNYDFFSPIMLDFRPVAERVQTAYELCHNEVDGHHFWRSFVFGNDHYYFSSEFHEVLYPLCPWVTNWEYRTCRKVWQPEERMKPLLDWIEAKEERKAEWAGFYPAWTQRYRPQWIVGN